MNRKKCKVCASLIQKDAKKCLNCDSYQDFRRYLGASHTTLALLIALISVLTTTFPTIEKLYSKFKGSNQEISGSVLDVLEFEKVTVAVTNPKKIPCNVSKAYYTPNIPIDEKSKKCYEIYPNPEIYRSASFYSIERIINANTMKHFFFVWDWRMPEFEVCEKTDKPFDKSGIQKEPGYIAIEIVDFNNNHKMVYCPLSVKEAIGFLGITKPDPVTLQRELPMGKFVN